MKNFPYYYFTHSNYPYFKSNRSKPSINTKILYNVVIASTGIFALAILTEIYKRYFMNHAYWARWVIMKPKKIYSKLID